MHESKKMNRYVHCISRSFYSSGLRMLSFPFKFKEGIVWSDSNNHGDKSSHFVSAVSLILWDVVVFGTQVVRAWALL